MSGQGSNFFSVFFIPCVTQEWDHKAEEARRGDEKAFMKEYEGGPESLSKR